MSGTFSQAHTFRRGCLGNDGRILFLLVNDQLALDRVPHTSVVLWDNGRFKPVSTVAWTACAQVLVDWHDAEFVVVGEQGQQLKVRADGSAAEVGRLSASALAGMPLKAAVYLEQSVVVVGAGFSCFAVRDDGKLQDLSPSKFGVDTAAHGVGFEGVAGSTLNDLLAVGWDGAIWHFDGRRWNVESSPTNAILSDVIRLPDDEYWICGQMGTVLRGRVGNWRLLETGVQDNLWSLAFFENAVFASSTRQLFRFDLALDVPQVVGLDCDPATCYWVDSKQGNVLLSTGAKNVVLVLPEREYVIE
jgi:hypothetical protein